MENFNNKVKKIVKNNFKISREKYFEFEKKYNFFYNLAYKLGEFLNIQSFHKVIDIGCGYGVSVNAIKNEFKTNNVIGIDISEEMINFGKNLYPHLKLIVGDGEEILKLFREKFDIAVYNASIFIFPDTLTAFKNAYEILSENGILGFTHYPDIINNNGTNLFDLAYKLNNFPVPQKRVISDINTCINNLKIANFKNIEIQEFSIDLKIDVLIDFFSIPAQSASLFPKYNYQERKTLIKKLFSKLKDFENSGKIVWKMVKAIKK